MLEDGSRQALTDRAEIESVWGVSQPPNLRVSASPDIDVWDVPREMARWVCVCWNNNV
ncbi:hypothetical protein [Haloactinopolyspora alba]|uniref:hypothetical protein n=1 Tax=Haloactinopolyspora alba TaxID=648780 RepID=UPI0013EAF599|nr:hypothetical protein [Haloactinopolyspora alba]